MFDQKKLNFESGAAIAANILHNEDVFVHSDGLKFSAADGTLQVINDFDSDFEMVHRASFKRGRVLQSTQ